MTQLIAHPDDIQAIARAMRAAEQRIRAARSRFAAAAHVAQAMGRDDLASNYSHAHTAMTKALDQLIESFSNGALQFEAVSAVYTNTDQTLGKDFARSFDSTVDGLSKG